MRRKRLLVLAGVVLAVAVAVPAARELYAYRQKVARGRLIDREHCDGVKEGMSQAEVEEALGGPPGDFRTEGVVYHLDTLTAAEADAARWECWGGDEGVILVLFDRMGVVQGREYIPARKPPLAERVRAWLRRHGF